MSRSTTLQRDQLVDRLLEISIIQTQPDSPTGRPPARWDEYAVLLNGELMSHIVDYWRRNLEGSYDCVCPTGKSGLAVGVIAARAFGKQLIWIDNDGRVIPQSRELTGLRVAVIDSLSFLGAHFSMSYSRLMSRKVKRVDFYSLVMCDMDTPDHDHRRLRLPSDPNSIITVSEHIVRFRDRLQSLLETELNEETCKGWLSSHYFWGRVDDNE